MGTVLIVASVVGLAVLSAMLLIPETPAHPVAAPLLDGRTFAQPGGPAPNLAARTVAPRAPLVTATQAQLSDPSQAHVSESRQAQVSDPSLSRNLSDRRHAQVADPSPSVTRNVARPITHVEIPAIGLSADVVPASLIPLDGGLTWEVPAFKIGHAETTADAGQPGNAILLGHVTSLRSGDVFARLDQVKLGQSIHVFSETQEFDYSVVSTTHVPRTDTSTIEQHDDMAAVSLITCTGMWLPILWDYAERLVVRAELTPSQARARDQVERR
jgi:LPXTG-site transpeptidase (sortase) family protein